MEKMTIRAERRGESGTQDCRHLRRRGIVPGVVYGHGEEGINISLGAREVVASLHSGVRVFDLTIEGRPDEKVLIKAVQYDSMGSEIMHVDLQRIALTETVR
jgi:large subunit ribosomal protein L25